MVLRLRPLMIAACCAFSPACDMSATSSPGPNETGGTSAATGGTTGTGTGGVVGSGGQAPATGGAATGGTRVMKEPSTYPHNSAGAKYPYPQGHSFPRCTFPAYNTDSIATAYTNWKTKFFQGGRVIRPENSNDTVSEGIAYGMLIGVYMNDKPMFDALWSYAKAHFDGNGLMNWRIDASGSTVGMGSATDADEDMAWALAMASSQWGGTYAAEVSTLLNNIWNHEVEGGSNVLKPGDNFGGSSQTNPSYFAPSYYLTFGKFSSHDWQGLYNKSYDILVAASGAYGLVPNWVNSSGAGVNGPSNDTNGPYFGYDACRTPFRIALDYCQSGEPRAKAYLDKITAFYVAQTPLGIGQMKDGYTAAGSNPPGTLGDYAAGYAFFGPAGAAALPGGHDAFLTAAYQAVESGSTQPAKLAINGAFTYYHGSWGVLSLLAMSGNYWDMTQ